jgi:hypothetical protein
MKTAGSICGEKKILSTENNVRLNRDDNNHVLLMAIYVDLVSRASVSIPKVQREGSS